MKIMGDTITTEEFARAIAVLEERDVEFDGDIYMPTTALVEVGDDASWSADDHQPSRSYNTYTLAYLVIGKAVFDRDDLVAMFGEDQVSAQENALEDSSLEAAA